MTQYLSVNIKLSNSRLYNSKSATMNEIGVSKLLLTDGKFSKLCTVFANNSSAIYNYRKHKLLKYYRQVYFLVNSLGH